MYVSLLHLFVRCSYSWVDDDTIGVLLIPPDRGTLPARPPVPIGPNIQDNTSGKTSQVFGECTSTSEMCRLRCRVLAYCMFPGCDRPPACTAALQARTYPDLLKSGYDEELFKYYCRSNLAYIKVQPTWSCL